MPPRTSGRSRRAGAALVALVALVVLAGCANDSGDGAASGSTTTAAARSSTTVAPAEVEPIASAGCGASAVGPGETKVSSSSGDEDRWYFLRVPPRHDGTTPVPLVLDLHGYGEGAQIHLAMSALGPFGDEHGFVTVTPQGAGAVAGWDVALDSPDVAYIGELLDEVEAAVCVDLARIHVAGLSNGAMMASSIACRYADRVAAVATVAGLRAIEGCAQPRPVPVIAFHGTADLYVSYDGGLGPAIASLPGPEGSGSLAAETDVGPSVPDMAATWAIRNGCDATPSETPVAHDVALLAWDCPPGADVQLYRIADGGHSWPGSEFSEQVAAAIGRTTMSVSANELIWDFFVENPLPAR